MKVKAWVIAVVACLGLLGCVDVEFGGGKAPTGVPPEVEVVPRVIPTVVLGSEFDTPERLLLPTVTPVPARGKEWNGFGVAPDGAADEDVPEVGLSQVPDWEPIPSKRYVEEPFDFVAYSRSEGVWVGSGVGGLVSCVDQFRRMVVAYDGRQPFGPEVAEGLSAELIEMRPDCVEQEWAPEFGLEPVCIQDKVAGERLPGGLLRREGDLGHASALSTRKDGVGNVLLHFDRVPFEDTRGCWVFTKFDARWAWAVSGVGSGVDAPRFPWCEQALREKLLGLGDGGKVGSLEVVRGIEEVRSVLSGRCRREGWELFPQDGGHVQCGGEVTGWVEKDVLVVNWQMEYPASGGAVCWVYVGETGEWLDYMPGGER